MSDVWGLVHRERTSLVADLEKVEPSRWDEPSLCPGWSVHDIVAHLVDNARATTPRLLAGMIRARGDFDRQNAAGVARERGTDTAQTLGRLRSVVTRTSSPPVSRESRLVEEVVHGEDIRHPLGVRHAYATNAVERALRYQLRTAVGMGGARERVADLTLVDTDTGVTYGTGPIVRGASLALLMVASGRSAFLDQLHGDGVAVLEAR